MATVMGVPEPAESTTEVVCTLPPDVAVSRPHAIDLWEGIEGIDRRPDKMSSVALPEPPAITPELDQHVRENPEWHALRLFGRGRHPGAFESGSERDRDL